MVDSDELAEEMIRYYEARAPWHDQYMNVNSLQEMTSRFEAITASVRHELTGKRVLEIACGTGNWTHLLSGLAASVTGVDSSPLSLQLARAKLENARNVKLILDDAFCLESATDSHEVLFAADFWSHIPKERIATFLTNVSAKMANPKRAIFLDMSWNKFFQDEQSILDANGNRVSLRTLPDGSKFRVVKNFPSESELRSVIAPVGHDISYTEFRDLQRWMVCFTLKRCEATR